MTYIKVCFSVKIKGILELASKKRGCVGAGKAQHISLTSKLIKAVADPDLELREGGKVWVMVLVALLTFLLPVISIFLPKIRKAPGPRIRHIQKGKNVCWLKILKSKL